MMEIWRFPLCDHKSTNHVNNIHPIFEEVPFIRSSGEPVESPQSETKLPEKVLKGEPGDTEGLNEGQHGIVYGVALGVLRKA